MLLSRRIAFSGISVSLILLFIAASFLSPVADFALFSLTSLCVALVVIHAGFRTGLAAYLAASLLIFFIFGILYAAPFIVLFGIYPIFKGLLESRLQKTMAYLIKAVCFLTVMVVGWLIFSEEISSLQVVAAIRDRLGIIGSGGAMAIAVLSGIVLLMVYDYALTLMIGFFGNRIGKILRK